jgi:hypothetical protein
VRHVSGQARIFETVAGLQDPPLRLTYIGGPTLLLELGGLRFLADPG